MYNSTLDDSDQKFEYSQGTVMPMRGTTYYYNTEKTKGR
jgi:hypothetical protein